MITSQNRLRENIVRQYSLRHDADDNIREATDEESRLLFNAVDQQFLDHCILYVKENMNKPDFNINALCREIAMSRTVLYEKLKALTGQSPGEFIMIIRMRRAAELLQNGEQVQDVAVKIGMADASYFSTVFKKHYGISPSRFKKKPSSNTPDGVKQPLL